MDNSQSPAKDLSRLNSFRQSGCVSCESNEKLRCPSCPHGQSCIYTIQSCTECPKAFCRADDIGNIGGKGHDGPSGGAIAGGVIGGLIAISVITYLVWRFLIKPKRSSRGEDRLTSSYEVETNPTHGVEKSNASGLGRRTSTHTVHSIASTVLTRASNIIQIAYIPGVTNRASPTSPDVLVPPVPPIPAHHGDDASSSEHFFVPGKLRDSTYSGYSSTTDRTSFAPRSSIASTIYGRQAEVQTASHGGMRAKPTVVSVKPGPNTPPVPSIDMERYGVTRPESSASAFSVGAATCTATATSGRAQVVKVSGLKKIDIGAKPGAGSLSASSPKGKVEGKESGEEMSSKSVDQDATPRGKSPFDDPPSSAAMSQLSAIKEEKSDGESWSSSKTGTGPFGDEHATKE